MVAESNSNCTGSESALGTFSTTVAFVSAPPGVSGNRRIERVRVALPAGFCRMRCTSSGCTGWPSR